MELWGLAFQIVGCQYRANAAVLRLIHRYAAAF